jgi:hypothetical protein
MKNLPLFSLFILLAMLTSACQPDNTALGRVQSVVSSYQAGNGDAFERQMTTVLRQSSAQCPNKLQYGCLQLAYKNFGVEQHVTAQSPQSFTFFDYEKQTAPDVRMVLVEGNWGGSPAVISCQVFFVITNGSIWLVDNFDIPQAMTCQQRSAELTRNLFGSSDGPTPTAP